MKAYTKKTVLDYYYGNDIEDYDIDELENDPTFMGDVLTMTKDKRMYELCSESVKKDFDFVKRILPLFKGNDDELIKIAGYFLIGNKDSTDEIEIMLIVRSLLVDKGHNINIVYGTTLTVFYQSILIEIEQARLAGDKNFDRLLQRGFILMIENYSSRPVILDYLAEEFIKSILESKGEDIRFEEFIHRSVKSKETILENSFMINLMGRYDETLAQYLSTHLYLLDDYTHEIERVKRNWDNYNKWRERELYRSIVTEIENRVVSQTVRYPYNVIDTLILVGNELGILDKLIEYNPEFDWDKCDMDLDDIHMFPPLTSVDQMSDLDRAFYEQMKKMAEDAIKANGTYEFEDEYIIKPQEGKIIQFKPTQS